MENTEIIKSYNFSSIKYTEIERLVKIKGKINDAKFDDWFDFFVDITENDTLFFDTLINKNRLLLPSYSEEKLKMKFISSILNKVDFATDTVQDFYDGTLSGMVNGVELKGFADFMVASGTQEPNKPYFFIQEFKPSIPDRNPEVQLLAEMLVTIEKNQTNIMRGGYIIGRNWSFMILEKIAENQFEYAVSKQFDSLDLEDLKKIYIILQAVKHKYCKD